MSPAVDARTSPLDVAVNLLWCVPGDVGGSEEYLVRQLIGLAERSTNIRPTIYCLDSFVDAHPELHELYPMVSTKIDEAMTADDASWPSTPGSLVGPERPMWCTTAEGPLRPSVAGRSS